MTKNGIIALFVCSTMAAACVETPEGFEEEWMVEEEDSLDALAGEDEGRTVPRVREDDGARRQAAGAMLDRWAAVDGTEDPQPFGLAA
ncbi:MAG: hypothetical protein KDK70_42475, partial [Myxococcales bacterium]|nr:hypothetical protein [Myxococcales bacterium]